MCKCCSQHSHKPQAEKPADKPETEEKEPSEKE